MFAQSLYSVDINENITTGAQILQLVAADKDLGQNREVQYSIVSGNELERFLIDTHSGKMYVQSPLDRDPPRNEVSFLIKVKTRGRPRRSPLLSYRVVRCMYKVPLIETHPEMRRHLWLR